MVSGLRLGIVGATGEVGRKMVKLLEDSKLRVSELRLFATERSAGTRLKFRESEITVEKTDEDKMKLGFDYLLFSAGASTSKRYAPIAVEHGTTVIDNSSAFRMEKEIPLVVPEINGDLLKDYFGIIANPNCSTIQMVLSLHRIHRKFGVKKIVITTLQSVSGAGRKGINELMRQMEGDEKNEIFPRPIKFNVIPLIGSIDENGFCTEEMKLVNETRKILGDESIEVVATTVRVPVIYGHSESIYVELEKEISSLDELKDTMCEEERIVFSKDIVTPIEIADTDEVYISRIRMLDERRFVFWNVADNIRVGAATNAVKILEKHLELNRKG